MRAILPRRDEFAAIERQVAVSRMEAHEKTIRGMVLTLQREHRLTSRELQRRIVDALLRPSSNHRLLRRFSSGFVTFLMLVIAASVGVTTAAMAPRTYSSEHSVAPGSMTDEPKPITPKDHSIWPRVQWVPVIDSVPAPVVPPVAPPQVRPPAPTPAQPPAAPSAQEETPVPPTKATPPEPEAHRPAPVVRTVVHLVCTVGEHTRQVPAHLFEVAPNGLVKVLPEAQDEVCGASRQERGRAVGRGRKD